jgi:two-component system NarL family response regulator
MEPISVLIVDDHTLMRQGLRRILEEAGMQIAGEAENGQEAVAKTLELSPDVVLMDIQMPLMDGIQATREIKSLAPRTTVVILTMHEEEEYLFEAIKAGAIGYLQKNKAPQELIKVIEAAREGLSLLPPALATRVLNEFAALSKQQEQKLKHYTQLTSREREVLKLIAQGLSNKEIAKELYISDKTVKNHLSNIFAKLQINDRTKAAILAVKEGLID